MLARASFELGAMHFRPSRKNFLRKSTIPICAYLHRSSIIQTIYPLRMPALSPTMESGQISRWNVKAGEQFSAGDVLLTVETDKAEVDVEAQDDGYMGSQLFGPGSENHAKTVKVGELIAVLGEQPEDVQGNVSIPAEWKSQSSSASDQKPAQATHQNTSNPSKQAQIANTVPQGHSVKSELPLSPAVSRLLHSLGVQNASKIRGTGLRGRLTKGDVLTHFKQASSPNGTAQEMFQADAAARVAERSQLGLSSGSKSTELDAIPLDGLAMRQLITEGLHNLANRPSSSTSTDLSFDSVLQDYDYPSLTDPVRKPENSPSLIPSSHDKYFDALV